MKVKSIGANQTELTLANGDQVFFSYETPVAAIVDGLSYKTEKKFSTTTTRHLNKWLGRLNATEKPQSFFENLVN